MKSLIFKIGGIAIVIIALFIGWNYIKSLQESNEISEQNRIASVEMYNQEKNKTYALNVKCEDLNRMKDSHIRELDSIRTQLGIKDKQLKSLYGSISRADLKDSIFVPVNIYHNDTVFKNISDYISLDTCVGDTHWYNVCVENPDSNLIVLSAHFTSDLALITSQKKEIVNKPRKTWLGRLFQHKVKTISVTAIEQNPYVVHDSTLFILPIK